MCKPNESNSDQENFEEKEKFVCGGVFTDNCSDDIPLDYLPYVGVYGLLPCESSKSNKQVSFFSRVFGW